MAKIVPSGRLRCELDVVLVGVGERDDRVEAAAWIGAWLILQQALEDEVTVFLGVSASSAPATAAAAARFYRNGLSSPGR